MRGMEQSTAKTAAAIVGALLLIIMYRRMYQVIPGTSPGVSEEVEFRGCKVPEFGHKSRMTVAVVAAGVF